MPIRRHALALGLAGMAGAALAPSAFAQEAPLKVVASFSILGDMVREVAGDGVDLTVLVGPNGDAHVFEPSPADAKAVGEADVLVVNGLGFEGWMPRLREASGFDGRIVVASEGVAPRTWDGEQADEHGHEAGGHDHDAAEHAAEEHAHESAEHEHADDDGHAAAEDHAHEAEHAHGAFDPHAWQDLENGIAYVNTIAAALGEAAPAQMETFEANRASYVAELEALHDRIHDAFEAIPEERRQVVTSHDAFGYFADAYHVVFTAPQGVSTEAEPSARAVARIIDQIRTENITAVFVENVTDPRLRDQIVRETGAKIGGELYSDALSGADGPAPTYARMFEFNASQLTSAMSGS